jgi:hypothetical protein
MGTIVWFVFGIVVGVAFDEFFTRVWKYIKARGEKAVADIDD